MLIVKKGLDGGNCVSSILNNQNSNLSFTSDASVLLSIC